MKRSIALRAAAERAGVSLRTVTYWLAEGLAHERQGGRVYVRIDHVLAWRRWKSLNNSAMQRRRAAAARRGITTAHVTEREYEKARREWLAAGGREQS